MLEPRALPVPRARCGRANRRTPGITLAHYARATTSSNLSAPLWIESYLWAGPPAVALVFFLLGAAGRRMDDVRHRLRDRAGTLAALLVPAFAFYQIVFLRGSLLRDRRPADAAGGRSAAHHHPRRPRTPGLSRRPRRPHPTRPASIPGTGGHP
ncbi:hypothetical protein LT493_12345 [Streptomyces tricolor]|nr:hypothetical protein [Streptomyces tricolor]